jgi:adenine-specific DNA-methyltransferase
LWQLANVWIVHTTALDDSTFEPDSAIFSNICDELTDEHSPYNFDSIPVEILGRIYERFLGKIVLAKRKTIEVVEKEDVRKAGGVFYTPDYIVAYMVEHSLGQQTKGKKPEDILKLRIIDTACGSGSFLIGVFAHLTHELAIYWRKQSKHPKGVVEVRDGEAHLTLQYKRQILLNCIYGVDIDPQAVEVAQLSLYLKLLEEETTDSANQQKQLEIGVALLPSRAVTYFQWKNFMNLSHSILRLLSRRFSVMVVLICS